MNTRTSHSIIAALALLMATGTAIAGGARPMPVPPPEALSACESQAEDASCSFTGRHGETLSGSCLATPDATLACRPDGMETSKRHGPPRMPKKALAACDHLDEGTQCSFIGRQEDSVLGHCVSLPDEQLACMPDDMPPPGE